MNKKYYCWYCDKDIVPIIREEDNEYVIRGEKVTLHEKLPFCPICSNQIDDGTMDDQLRAGYDAYLNLFGLSFQKLKDIRKSYHLSQELFAKALGWGKKTIVRYENVESLPQVQYLQVYKKIENNKSEFIKILNVNKPTLEEKTYNKICSLINYKDDSKTENTILFLLNCNSLNVTQLMKNLFAVDFLSYKMNGKSITNLNYAHASFGPIVDKRTEFIDNMIRNNMIKTTTSYNDAFIIFENNIDPNISVFDSKELDVLKKVKKALKNKTAGELTNWSHNFVGWKETKMGKEIDFKYAEYFELP